MKPDEIAFVVIGRNEGPRLADCLLSLKDSPYRVVYVDSGSTDGSTTLASDLGACVVELDKSRPFSAARARNEGFTAIRKLIPEIRLVQFVDGDCSVDRGWICAAAAFLEKRQDVAVVCGRRRERFPDRSIYNALCDIEWNTPCGEASSCGGDSLVRVTAFESVGGFRPELMAGEEPELCARLRQAGWKIWRLDAEMTRHDVNLLKFGQWWRRMVRSGYGYAEISRLTRGSKFQLYRTESNRAIFWGGILPLVLLAAAAFHPLALVSISIYPLQVIRIAFRRGFGLTESWSYAWYMVAGKFAEFQGVLKYYWTLLSGRNARRIDYKIGGT